MKTYKKLLGNKIRDIRKKKGFKTYQVAESLSLNPGSYRNMESGNQTIASEYLEKISRMFNCKIDDLIWEDNWNDILDKDEKENVLKNYIHPITEEIKLRQAKARQDIEKNILNSIMLEVEQYQNSEFRSFVKGDDYLDILDSVKNEIELRVKQLHKRYINSKNPSEYKVGVAPNGVKYKYKDI